MAHAPNLSEDRALPDTQWTRKAHRLRTEFDPTGAELFSLTNSTLRTLARLLARTFVGAIVHRLSEPAARHESTVTACVMD